MGTGWWCESCMCVFGCVRHRGWACLRRRVHKVHFELDSRRPVFTHALKNKSQWAEATEALTPLLPLWQTHCEESHEHFGKRINVWIKYMLPQFDNLTNNLLQCFSKQADANPASVRSHLNLLKLPVCLWINKTLLLLLLLLLALLLLFLISSRDEHVIPQDSREHNK